MSNILRIRYYVWLSQSLQLGGKVGLITRDPMGEGALKRPEKKCCFYFIFLFQVISVITNLAE